MPPRPTLPSLAQNPVFALIRRSTTALTSTAATQAVLAAALLTLCPLAQAQEPAYGLSGRVGLGMAMVPTYEGSPHHRMLTSPNLALSYRTRDWGTFEFGQRGLLWNAIEAGQFRLALVAQLDLGRKDKDTSTVNPTPGDKRLAGMGNVQSSTEVGLGIGYGPLMVVARQSLSERGPKGAQVDMTVEIPLSLSDRLDLRFAVGATWANRDYMQTYFGVTTAQAQATSFSVYTPKSGCRKVEASLGAEYAMAPSWKLQANIGFSQLGDDAAASPLVGRRIGSLAALAVAHEF